MSSPVAIVISLASLALGWLLYDTLCKSPLAENPTTLMVLLFGILVVMAWGYTQVFTGRAALLHLGRLHRHDHVGERVLRHHAEPADRRRRSQGRPHA